MPCLGRAPRARSAAFVCAVGAAASLRSVVRLAQRDEEDSLPPLSQHPLALPRGPGHSTPPGLHCSGGPGADGGERVAARVPVPKPGCAGAGTGAGGIAGRGKLTLVWREGGHAAFGTARWCLSRSYAISSVCWPLQMGHFPAAPAAHCMSIHELPARQRQCCWATTTSQPKS
jgi:hypothetical protein